MKKILPAVAIVALSLTITSCIKKSIPAPAVKEPVMLYTDLSGQILKNPNSSIRIDLNKDGIPDVMIQTFPLGAIDRYELQFRAFPNPTIFLSIDDAEQTAPFLANDKITIVDIPSHHWIGGAPTILMNNIVPAGAPYWAGNWQNLSHVFLPLKQLRNGNSYAGWIELSTNTQTGTIQLFRAAICTEPNVDVKAGM